jgi:hypothetical protein
LFPDRLDDYLAEDNPVRAIDVFVDELDLAKLSFGGVDPDSCACRKSNPNILVVQPAQDRAAKNGPGRFDGARDRRILLQR